MTGRAHNRVATFGCLGRYRYDCPLWGQRVQGRKCPLRVDRDRRVEEERSFDRARRSCPSVRRRGPTAASKVTGNVSIRLSCIDVHDSLYAQDATMRR